MALRPSSVPQRVVLHEPPASSLPHVPDPEFDLAQAASPTVTRLLATVVTDPDLESSAAFALVIELVDFVARSRLDYVASLVTESESVCPPSVGGELALGTDVFEDRQEDFECLAATVPRFASMVLAPDGDPDAPDIPTLRSNAEAITGPYSSQWQAAMDAEMASWKPTSTYVDEVPPPGSNIVDGMWIFRVKRPPGSKVRYIARGFSQRQGVDFFQTFSPTPKMTTLRVRLHIAAQRDYELHSLDFSTAFLQGSLHEEIWLCCPPNFTRSFPSALGFAPSSADPSLFLRTDTTMTPFYVLVYVDDLVISSSDIEALALVKAELQERQRALTWVLQRFGFHFSSPQPTPLSTGHSLSAPPSDESYIGHWASAWRIGFSRTHRTLRCFFGRRPGDSSFVTGLPFRLGSSSVSWRSTRSSSVLSSSCEAKIYAGAISAQELRWLTYLLTDLGEWLRSPPVLYVDKKAMLALCHEQRLEHRTKHIALRYFLTRELQQRCQVRLSYVAS
ncbi:unnamed protein product [Closterium sp. NIES-53]